MLPLQSQKLSKPVPEARLDLFGTHFWHRRTRAQIHLPELPGSKRAGQAGATTGALVITQAEQFDLEAKLSVARRDIALIREQAMQLVFREQSRQASDSGLTSASLSTVASLASDSIGNLNAAADNLRALSCTIYPADTI